MDYFNSFLELAPCLHIVYLSVSIAIATGVVLAMRQWLVARGGVSAYGLVDDNPTATAAIRRSAVLAWLARVPMPPSLIRIAGEPRRFDQWMERFHVDVQLSHTDRTGTSVVREAIPLEDLFVRLGRAPSFQLIVGDSGFGKTILCYKLLHDWTSRRDYLNGFDAVAYGSLETLGREPFELWMSRNMVAQTGSTRLGGERLLLVLDGLDEIPESAVTGRRTFFDFLEGKGSAAWLFREAHVVVTSRPPVSKSVHALFDRSFLICGFNEQQEKAFVGKLSHADPMDAVFEHPQFRDIGISPLIVNVLWGVKLSAEKPAASVTEAMTRVFRSLIRHALWNRRAREEFADVEEYLAPIGRFCLNVYRDEEYQGLSFTRKQARSELGEPVSERLFSIGVFHRTSTLRGERDTDEYKPIACTLMMYLIAIYLESRVRELLGAGHKVTLPKVVAAKVLPPISPDMVQYTCGRLGSLAWHALRFVRTEMAQTEGCTSHLAFNYACAIVNDCRHFDANISEAAKLVEKKMNLENYSSQIIPHYLDAAALLIASPHFSCEELFLTTRKYECEVLEKLLLLPLSKRPNPLKALHMGCSFLTQRVEEQEAERFFLLMRANVHQLYLDCYGGPLLHMPNKELKLQGKLDPKFKKLVFQFTTWSKKYQEIFESIVAFCSAIIPLAPLLEEVEIRTVCNPSESCIANLLLKRTCCKDCQILVQLVDAFVDDDLGYKIKTKCAIFGYQNRWGKVAACQVRKTATSLEKYLTAIGKSPLADVQATPFRKKQADINDLELVTVAIGVTLRAMGWTLEAVDPVLEKRETIDRYAPGFSVALLPFVPSRAFPPYTQYSSPLFNRTCFS